MSVFSIGQKGETDLCLVDTDARTVRPTSGNTDGAVDPELVDPIQTRRADGCEIARNADVMIGGLGRGDPTVREFPARA